MISNEIHRQKDNIALYETVKKNIEIIVSANQVAKYERYPNDINGIRQYISLNKNIQ